MTVHFSEVQSLCDSPYDLEIILLGEPSLKLDSVAKGGYRTWHWRKDSVSVRCGMMSMDASGWELNCCDIVGRVAVSEGESAYMFRTLSIFAVLAMGVFEH